MLSSSSSLQKCTKRTSINHILAADVNIYGINTVKQLLVSASLILLNKRQKLKSLQRHARSTVHTMRPEESEPLKDFATTCVNLHKIKYIFTYIQPHLFQTMF